MTGAAAPHPLAAEALRWRAAGLDAVVVTVAAHRGSVPREAGTRMLVGADRVHGTIGGGHLEWRAIADARAWLAGESVALEQRVPLGPALGQCCGGEVRLRLSRLAQDDPSGWPADPARFTVWLYGAGHVGRAVAALLAGLPCRLVWLDERDDAFPDAFPDASPHAFSHAFPDGAAPGAVTGTAAAAAAAEPVAGVERRAVAGLEAEAASAAPGDFHLVMTHSHDLDLRIVEAVLRRGDFGWLGLIGSATKRARFERRLADRGLPPDALQRLACPVGLPGLRGKEPAVIAVSVVAQLLLAAQAQEPGQERGQERGQAQPRPHLQLQPAPHGGSRD